MSMGRKMKDSGIAWIGEIPEEWKTIKLKYIFYIVGGNGFPDSLQGNTVGDYPFCKVSDINGPLDYVDTASNWITKAIANEKKFNILPIGSIIMAKIGAALSKNHRKINTVKCCIDNNTQALVPKRTDNIRFLFYLSKCIDMNWFDNNSTVPSVNNIRLLNFFVVDVLASEQTRIVSFLDAECARIDDVMEKTRASIEEYKKLKQSVITRAVTKGIRPNRPMKDSGIEWIGAIPADWKVLNLSAITVKLRNGYVGPTKDLFQNDGVPYIQSLHIKDGAIDFNRHEYYVSEQWANNHPKIRTNDILIVQTGEIGSVGLVTAEYDGCNCHALIIATPLTEIVSPLFLTYYFRSPVGKEMLLYYKTGALLPHLNSGKIKFAKVCVPCIQEQKEITNYLNFETTKINTIIAKKQQLLTELEAYKKSLIYEYVTGKKEVPA